MAVGSLSDCLPDHANSLTYFLQKKSVINGPLDANEGFSNASEAIVYTSEGVIYLITSRFRGQFCIYPEISIIYIILNKNDA